MELAAGLFCKGALTAPSTLYRMATDIFMDLVKLLANTGLVRFIRELQHCKCLHKFLVLYHEASHFSLMNNFE